MLQYIAQPSDNYSIAEQAQMAIEGGCGWIILRVPAMKEGEMRELATELVPLCKETGTILTLEDNPDMARELGLHGVNVTRHSKYTPAQVREMFGPEAIVGVEVQDVTAALKLQNLDIDFVTLEMNADNAIESATKLRNAEFALPIVAQGEYGMEDLPKMLDAGISGVAESSTILNADDPVAKTAEIIAALKR